MLYCYPEEIYDELIDEIASNGKVTKYLDLPIQHISDKILKLMGRKTSKQDIINKINKLREKISYNFPIFNLFICSEIPFCNSINFSSLFFLISSTICPSIIAAAVSSS